MRLALANTMVRTLAESLCANLLGVLSCSGRIEAKRCCTLTPILGLDYLGLKDAAKTATSFALRSSCALNSSSRTATTE